ncbi:MAG: FAD-dependent oxidoreductase, partial [Actinobacteria bacterium]|nr:FAD-dependent oxidoreductase [Actinomycetota bacterium]
MAVPVTQSPAELSLWWNTLPPELLKPIGSPLPGDTTADIAIVGAGYTGLWTAYYLLKADPSLRVAIVEANYAGFGASGRNGGWASALFPAGLNALAKASSRSDAVRMN